MITIAYMRQTCIASYLYKRLKDVKRFSQFWESPFLVQITAFSLTQGYILSPPFFSSLGILNQGEEVKRVSITRVVMFLKSGIPYLLLLYREMLFFSKATCHDLSLRQLSLSLRQ